MKILITGSSGLVGHNLLEAPQSKRYELLAPSHKELELLDKDAVLNYLEKNRPDLVIHAAGTVGGISANMQQPLKFLLDNLDMGRNVIYGAYRAGVKKFINLGSSCMYPRNHETPLTEDMILTGELEPTNEGYAIAKIACARMCSYITRENPDFQYKTLIPCNIYGRWDKFFGDRAHLIPAVIQRLIQAVDSGQEEIEIWGDGSARREFMYTGDLADCIWQAVERFDELPDLMNVGLGVDYSVDDYYDVIAKVIGFKGKFTHDLSKPAGMKRKLTDVSRMLKFGWRPKTTLEDGIRQTVDFYRKHVGSQKQNKIGIGWAFISDNGKRRVQEILEANRLSQGPMVYKFEKEFAKLHEQRYGIALNSGTSALHVGLEAMKEKFNWQPKSKVLVPAVTFIASSNSCLHAGLEPVFVDVDARTYNINPALIEEKIDKDTVAIMPVHLFGQPCDMEPIVDIAKRHDLKIIEDCAEAHFAKYKGKTVGSFGEVACFSTYVAHTITTGVGGLVTTNDRELMEISRSLLAHGRACTCEKCVASDPTKVCPLRTQTEMDKRFMFIRLGYSYRIGEFEGVIGLDQLENKDFIMDTRKANAHYLTENLQDVQDYLQLPWYPDYIEHSFMMYPLIVRKDAPFTRRDVTQWLEKNNIETRPMMPLLNQPIYKKLFGDIEKDYPVAEWINHYGFYVGCHHGLERGQLDKIIYSIHEFLKERKLE
ncbi:MAG: aminotransferase class I/II-fold pyridoxal phosphate-dependent enzyme [Selenomonadaceae bacterium]|nr:aminotransferase class I/II-fold pyridoxal phosphate-dependent enzyme [Selenomonadaceae bacterium]